MKQTTLKKDHLERWSAIGIYEDIPVEQIFEYMKAQTQAFKKLQKQQESLASTYIHMMLSLSLSKIYLYERGEVKLAKKINKMQKKMPKYIDKKTQSTKDYIDWRIGKGSERKLNNIGKMDIIVYSNMISYFR